MRTYFKELRSPTRPSRMTLVVYRFELLVAYNGNKLYVRSPSEHVHPNLDVLVQHELTPTEREEAEDF
jgi:hypothetical protein